MKSEIRNPKSETPFSPLRKGGSILVLGFCICLGFRISEFGIGGRLWAEEATPAAVKFEILRSKHLAVEIKVNGKGPYRVIFDTGAPTNLLSNKVAKEAGVLKKGGFGAFPALYGMQGQVKVKSLELGGLKAEDISVVVMDHPTLKAIAAVLGPLEGIIGFPFFAQYRMTLDYQSQTMTFVPVNYRAGDVMEAMMLKMLDRSQKPAKKHLAPTTVWGFAVEKEAGDETAGVTVRQVFADSAAAAAGLQVGDRLLTLDGTWTDSVVDCYRAAVEVTGGQGVKAKVLRRGKEVEVALTARNGL